MDKTAIQKLVNTGVEFPAFAWPGGYPLYYLCEDNGVLCPVCANSPRAKKATVATDNCPDDKQWKIIASDIHFEGDPIICDNCYAEIESAYGIPALKE